MGHLSNHLNRAQAFGYIMSQDHFAMRVKSITDSMLGQLEVRNDEFRLQQEENTNNYDI